MTEDKHETTRYARTIVNIGPYAVVAVDTEGTLLRLDSVSNHLGLTLEGQRQRLNTAGVPWLHKVKAPRDTLVVERAYLGAFLDGIATRKAAARVAAMRAAIGGTEATQEPTPAASPEAPAKTAQPDPTEPAEPEEQTTTPEPHVPATLAPMVVDGWTLFTGEGGTWIRDMDLAVRAGLAKPRNIRIAIHGAIADGAIVKVGALSEGAGETAVVREVCEVMTSGLGRELPVVAYYLNDEAAILVLARLRTPTAVAMTKMVVRVFMLATQGRLPGQVQALDANAVLAAIAAQSRTTTAILDRLTSLESRVAEVAGSAALITSAQADELHNAIEYIARSYVYLGDYSTVEGARMSLSNFIGGASRWAGTGRLRAMMTQEAWTDAMACLRGLRLQVDRRVDVEKTRRPGQVHEQGVLDFATEKAKRQGK